MKKTSLILLIGLSFSFLTNAQGLIQNSLQTDNPEYNIQCGSNDFMTKVDSETKHLLELSDQILKNINHKAKSSGYNTGDTITNYTVPVVFHVVYNDSTENIPDSVFYNQLEVLNACYRRTNEDTANTRDEFKPYVADTRINFELASIDPNGNPTTGITHTFTPIEYFGGVLPYNSSQQSEILQWVNDSLFYNYFRITNDSLGGISGWDPNYYINVWIGDFRIFEPQFGNFEEVVYFGLSTPPVDHYNWPDSLLGDLQLYSEGILIHYPVIGPNNPQTFQYPYNVYNGLVNTGKMLVHEIGHYLGLRHIWGDGDCSHDDFVYDTPNASAASQYNCNTILNTCIDSIDGQNLHNMIENYMDYSSADCQNSFTWGQKLIMNEVLEIYRPDLATKEISIGIPETQDDSGIRIYPNPTQGTLTLDNLPRKDNLQIRVRNMLGQIITDKTISSSTKTELAIHAEAGIYIIEIISEKEINSFKIIKN